MRKVRCISPRTTTSPRSQVPATTSESMLALNRPVNALLNLPADLEEDYVNKAAIDIQPPKPFADVDD
ncbi:hypothetical protein Tdes44962_MAKER06096 [Teratosphaeria destructans]|uniref:Uncharacterized protein n=1 Tax=Teratosphaeria destructans TaxID=418781 RepID=A0A9W7VXZ8_9PEZI|nr:hypothetical protein Tdes44962_MAKER06096 [Teratosphaeria destructans]